MSSRSRHLIPLRAVPSFPRHSPEVVRILDRIRFEFDADDANDGMAEFAWFAREYPRVYRHHIEHIAYRLTAIHARYQRAHSFFSGAVENSEGNCYRASASNDEAIKVYWDFEALLNAVGSALDVLARIVGTAYEENTPPSFAKICRKDHLAGYVDILRAAQIRWVARMKDYRDCFVHYTCVDTFLSFSCNEYSDGFELRCRIPTNPNVRDILGFRFSRRMEVLRYASRTYANLLALDRAIARKMKSDYLKGVFPKRTENLFFIGTRMHQKTTESDHKRVSVRSRGQSKGS